jgi:hypothetical protein
VLIDRVELAYPGFDGAVIATGPWVHRPVPSCDDASAHSQLLEFGTFSAQPNLPRALSNAG